MQRLFTLCSIWAALGFSTAHAQQSDAEAWKAALERVVPSVVAIRVTGTRDFDTENARSSVGTGFVVDAENGWILTNRHMVHAGPVIAEAVLENSEEIPLQPVYRDPVHDFGFYRYDPDSVRFMELEPLPLHPEGAQIGTDIRVVGNDAGEKISILDSTLARVDRNAPNYGGNTYNDFNTFYIQAATNTSGGSSGSPVVDIEGRVVALNAGGSNRAASSFYLPLDRVVRAFDHVKRGEAVPRGTIQTTLRFEYFDELGRLGLPESVETDLRKKNPDVDGGLVVKRVLDGGPADGSLLPGDVVLGVNGETVVTFVDLEAALDDAVGETVEFDIHRGKRRLTVKMTVGDLHAITPAEYLEFGRAVLTPLSYMQARNHTLPVEGVYVSVAGYALATSGIPEGAVILALDGEPVKTLDDFERLASQYANGERVRVRFFVVNDEEHPYEAVMVVDRRWFEMRRCQRSEVGAWPCEASPQPGKPSTKTAPQSLVLPVAKKPASVVAPALVRVDFDIPYPTAGVKDVNYVGVGTIVDKSKGLVLVDRDTVPVRLGDLTVTFAGAVRTSAEVVFIHPTHNFSVIQYDPAAIGEVPVAEAELSTDALEEGDKVWLVGLDRKQAFVNLGTRIESVDALELGTTSTPRFRDANVEVYTTEDAEATLGGVLTDKKGRVVASWASFLDLQRDERAFGGLPTQYTRPIIEDLKAGRTPKIRVPGVELERITLDSARDRGLSDTRIQQLLEDDPNARTLFEVTRIHGKSAALDVVRNTDVVLEVDGELLTSLRQLDSPGPSTTWTVLRNGQEKSLTFDTLELEGRGVDRVVSWAGMTLHEPHYEVAAQGAFSPKGVYAAWYWYGSPAARYQLSATRRILAVNDTETPDLDTFLEVVSAFGDGEAVRLTMETQRQDPIVKTLKLDLKFWPTQLFEVRDGRWTRVPVEAD